MFKANAKADMVAVPYKGGAPAMSDVIGGQVPVIFDALGPAMAHIKAGKVRPLAVTRSRCNCAAISFITTGRPPA